METRTVEQVRLYVLALNTFNRAEDSAVACVSDSYDRLVEFYNSQVLEIGYRENGWYFSFKEGRLRYFNPCHSLVLGDLDMYGNGIHSEWCDIEKYYEIQNKYYFI